MALNTGELSALLTLDDSKFQKGMDDADRKSGKLGDTVSKTGALAAAGMVTAGVAAAGFAYKATMAASDLGENISKTDNVFKSSAATIHAWSENAAKDFGQSKRQAEEAAGTFGNLFVQLGIGGDKAADMSMQMTELASDFASFHNADISEVIGAQTAAFRGEYDALQRFVPTINAAAVEQKALEMTHKATTKELTAQEKALATQTLMMEGAGDAMGDFDRTNDSLANRLRTAQAASEDFSSRVGSKLLPVVLDAWDAFDRISPVIGKTFSGALDTATKTVAPLADTVQSTVAKVGGYLTTGQYSFSQAFGADKAYEDMGLLERGAQGLGSVLGGVFSGAGNYSLSQLLQAGQAEEDMSRFQAAIANVSGVLTDFYSGPIGQARETLGSMFQNAQTIAASAVETFSSIFGNITELVGAFFSTFQKWTSQHEGTVSEWRDKVSGLFASLSEAITLAWEAIGVAFDVGTVILTTAFDIIRGVFDVATGVILNLWGRFGTHLLDHLATAFDAIMQVLGGVFEAIRGIFNIFIGVFTGDWGRAWEGVKQLFGGVWDVIVGIVQFAINAVSTVIGAGMAVISAAWGYVWRGIQEVFSAVWDGIVAYVRFQINSIVGIVHGIGAAISGAASGAFDGLKSAFTAAINFIIRKWNDLSFGLPDFDVMGQKVKGFRLDTPNIPLLATGGIVAGAGLAVVGEAGPELVNLNRGASVVPLPPGGSAGTNVTIDRIEINGVRDADDVLSVLPDLERALVAGLGRAG